MAHNLTTRIDGTTEAAFALKPAWHGLGAVLDHTMTGNEILEAAHLDWGITQRPLYMRDALDFQEEVASHVANCRADNGNLLGVVGKGYVPFPNRSAMEFMDALAGETGMEFESAGSMKDGKRVWFLARRPEVATIADGDQMSEYVLLYIGHDGGQGITVQPTSVRVVCWNTLTQALRAQDASRTLNIYHTGAVQTRLNEAKRVLGFAHDQHQRHVDLAAELVNCHVDASQVEMYLERVYPLDADATPRMTSSVIDTRAEARNLYLFDSRQTMPGVVGTAWAALNAVTHREDHGRPPFAWRDERKQIESRFTRVMFGQGAAIKLRAERIAARMFAPAFAADVLGLEPVA